MIGRLQLGNVGEKALLLFEQSGRPEKYLELN
jgi:hypothetical protein